MAFMQAKRPEDEPRKIRIALFPDGKTKGSLYAEIATTDLDKDLPVLAATLAQAVANALNVTVTFADKVPTTRNRIGSKKWGEGHPIKGVVKP